MNIPHPFKIILEKDTAKEGVVKYTISQFRKILEENKLFFFEEYTDHGINHISDVLHLSAKLIKEDTYKNILNKSPLSITIYILSVVLHDIGMHLTCEGFNTLINGANDPIRIKELDSKTWKNLWEDYLDEARRFGSIEKKNIIGDSHWLFRIPDTTNRDQLNGQDKKLIGEFIRRNHPRIAHEIAINGFPAAEGRIPFAEELDPALRNLCGLLARSHGIEIRNTFEYLEAKFPFTWVKPYNIELVFLMVVLRIADYFQITAERTPAILVKLKRFHSPISKIEFDKHLDVKYSQPYLKDPETIIFHCEPSSNLIYIKLSDLLLDIQKELDQSWAILGEAYGKNPKEEQPELMYRRIKSDVDIYASKQNYVAEKIKFEAATELPKLLVSPLYGNDPSYAIRELLQNAVDACRERAFVEGAAYQGIIRISFFKEEGQLFFQITDNGTGMSLNTIKNYLLRIGSSYRDSTNWKKEYLDKEGKSKVERTGKFGIGILAVFLLGTKISVETRNSKSSEGYYFETDLSTEYIEVSKIYKEDIGTTIKVPINMKTIAQLQSSSLSFDLWYTQASPKVIYEDHTHSFSNLGYINYTPGYHDDLPDNWYILPQNQFTKVLWSFTRQRAKGDYNFNAYSNNKTLSKLDVTCNGIIIPNIEESLGRYMPLVSIFDFDGALPVSLNRNKLEGPLPFMEELMDDINRYFIAKFLFAEVQNPFEVNYLEERVFSHPLGIDIGIAYAPRGFIFKTKYFIDKNRNRTYLQFSADDANSFPIGLNCNDSFISVKGNIRDLSDICTKKYNIRFLTSKVYYDNMLYELQHSNNQLNSFRKIIFDDVLCKDEIVECRNNYSHTHIGTEILESYLKNHTYVFETFINDSIIDLTPLNGYNVSLFFDESLSKMLKYYLNGKGFIPYSMKERKHFFSKTIEELMPYWEKQQKCMNKQAK